jgi:hypothetical protein
MQKSAAKTASLPMQKSAAKTKSSIIYIYSFGCLQPGFSSLYVLLVSSLYRKLVLLFLIYNILTFDQKNKERAFTLVVASFAPRLVYWISNRTFGFLGLLAAVIC